MRRFEGGSGHHMVGDAESYVGEILLERLGAYSISLFLMAYIVKSAFVFMSIFSKTRIL